MLRMRPKPPAGMPTINSGKPWSAEDLDDLQDFIREQVSVEAMADYLCRDVEEVEAKLAELRQLGGAA